MAINYFIHNDKVGFIMRFILLARSKESKIRRPAGPSGVDDSDYTSKRGRKPK